MSRTTVPEDAVTFHRPPNRSPSLSPTSLSEYTAMFVEEWRSEALCIDQNPDLFFPESTQSNLPAKRICEMCAVRLECLDYAIVTNARMGIWGGTVEKERAAIWRMVNTGWGLKDALVMVESKRRGRSKMRERVA